MLATFYLLSMEVHCQIGGPGRANLRPSGGISASLRYEHQQQVAHFDLGHDLQALR